MSTWDRRPIAIDIYNNYITSSHDNPIETDGSMHNIRVMRNMLINHASHAFCNQPALGGPVYWIRKIACNLPGGSTRLTGGSASVIFYNNTILSETSGTPQNAHWRNNLIMGQNSGPTIFSVTTNTNYTSSDYTGSGQTPEPRSRSGGAHRGSRSRWSRPGLAAKIPGSRRGSSRRWLSTAR